MPSLTLDTNLILEYWRQRERVAAVEELISLAEANLVDLAVTARIREDIPNPPLAERINQLDELEVVETGSVTRLGSWVLGRDYLGDETFVEFSERMEQILSERGHRPPDWRDWDHLHSHLLQGRDIFLTWDNQILELRQHLEAEFGIIVMSPEEYLESRE